MKRESSCMWKGWEGRERALPSLTMLSTAPRPPITCGEGGGRGARAGRERWILVAAGQARQQLHGGSWGGRARCAVGPSLDTFNRQAEQQTCLKPSLPSSCSLDHGHTCIC